MAIARPDLASIGPSLRRAPSLVVASRCGRRRCVPFVVACGLLLGLSGCGTDGDGERPLEADANGAAAATPRAAASPQSPTPATPPASPTAEGAVRPSIGGPPIPPTPGGSTAPFRSAVAEVGPIVWALEVDPRTKAPRVAVESFLAEAATLHAALPVARVEPGAVVEAAWSYNGTPLDGTVTEVVVDRTARGAWLEFHLSRRDETAWPDGIYAVRISIDGEQAQAAAVVVGPVPPAG